jgi:hypothetical protein
MHARGIRATARVLHTTPTTVMKEHKKSAGHPTGEEGDVAVPPPKAGAGRDRSRRGTRAAPRANLRTRCDVEVCGQARGAAAVMAHEG